MPLTYMELCAPPSPGRGHRNTVDTTDTACEAAGIREGGVAMACRRTSGLIICSRVAPPRRCVVCGTQYNIKLCDFPLTGPKAGQTCDRPVCGTHAHHVEPDTDLCLPHARYTAQLEMPHGG